MNAVSLVQKKIMELLEELESLRVISSHVDEINLQLTESYGKLKSLESSLDKELDDIVKLEKLTVKSLFYKTLGSQEQQLEKERQEYLEINLKYKEFKNSIELMEYERGLLEKKLHNIPQLEEELVQLKEKRKLEILSSEDLPIRNELNHLLKELEGSTILKREITEAIYEGQKSIKLIQIVISFLQQARQWGRWHPQGKRRSGSYMKHQAIDKALKNIHVAQHHLNLFARELRDLGENNINFNINMDHFNRFTDFFFDNLISDWIIQQRIKSTLANMESTRDHVDRIVQNLNVELKQNKEKIISLNKQKDDILTQ